MYLLEVRSVESEAIFKPGLDSLKDKQPSRSRKRNSSKSLTPLQGDHPISNVDPSACKCCPNPWTAGAAFFAKVVRSLPVLWYTAELTTGHSLLCRLNGVPTLATGVDFSSAAVFASWTCEGLGLAVSWRAWAYGGRWRQRQYGAVGPKRPLPPWLTYLMISFPQARSPDQSFLDLNPNGHWSDGLDGLARLNCLCC